jgi:glycosyltransferase involved in cell wall biosynthesis
VLSYLRDEAVEETERALGVQVPIVRVTKETLRDRIAELAASADERRRIGASSRAYVEHVHDADKGADRLIAIYDAL